MTNPTTSKSTPRNSTKAAENKVVEPVKDDVVTDTAVVENSVVAEDKVEETPKSRIPQLLVDNSILFAFCERYLGYLDEIAAYNKKVLAAKDNEWTTPKILAKAQELGNPDDATKINKDVKAALDKWEASVTAMQNAKKSVVEITSKILGIETEVTDDRDPEVEKPLREKHKVAVEIGKQLSTIATMTSDEAATAAVTEFLSQNLLPTIGRQQTRSFTEDGASTPKYRVTVTVTKDGKELLNERGFTKTSLALTKPEFGYERGKAIGSEELRKAWESAGNNSSTTVKNVVEFDDNGLHFTITKNA